MLELGDLIFVRGTLLNPIDDAIKEGEHLLDKTAFTSNYVHVAVYICGNTVMEARGFRKSGPGNIEDYAGKYDIGHIEMTDEQCVKFLAALRDEDNLPYDWLGIWWLIVMMITGYDRKYRERRRRYCSKYVGWALRQAGIVVNDNTPEELAESEPIIRIEKVTQG